MRLKVHFNCSIGLNVAKIIQTLFEKHLYRIHADRVFHPKHYGHLGPDNFLLWGAVLDTAGCLAAFLAGIYLLDTSSSFPSPSCDNQKYIE